MRGEHLSMTQNPWSLLPWVLGTITHVYGGYLAPGISDGHLPLGDLRPEILLAEHSQTLVSLINENFLKIETKQKENAILILKSNFI